MPTSTATRHIRTFARNVGHFTLEVDTQLVVGFTYTVTCVSIQGSSFEAGVFWKHSYFEPDLCSTDVSWTEYPWYGWRLILSVGLLCNANYSNETLDCRFPSVLRPCQVFGQLNDMTSLFKQSHIKH